MRYTIFDPYFPNTKGYDYTPEQIEYIVTEVNTNPNLYVFLDCHTPNIERLAGRLHNSRVEENGCITADLEFMKTPMGIISEQLELSGITLTMGICGKGTIKNNMVEDYTISHVNLSNA